MDALIAMYDITFEMLVRDLGIQLKDIVSWPLGRLVRLGLNMEDMMSKYKLTPQLFAEFKPRKFTEWKKRLRITAIHLVKLPMDPELLKTLQWNINLFLDTFHFTKEQLAEMEFTDKKVEQLKQLTLLAENLRKQQKKTNVRARKIPEKEEQQGTEFSIF